MNHIPRGPGPARRRRRSLEEKIRLLVCRYRAAEKRRKQREAARLGRPAHLPGTAQRDAIAERRLQAAVAPQRAALPGTPTSLASPGRCRLKAAFPARGGTGRMRPGAAGPVPAFRQS